MNAFLASFLVSAVSKGLIALGPSLAALGIQIPDIGATANTFVQALISLIGFLWGMWNHNRAINLGNTAPSNLPSGAVKKLSATAVLFFVVGFALIGSMTGCSSSSTPTPTPTPSPVSNAIETSLPFIRTGSAVATGAVLDFAVKQTSTRTRLANEMYSAANAIYSLSGGTFPTPAQFQASILTFGGSQTDASYAQFSTAVGALYAAYFPKLQTGDAKTATDLLNAIAGGIEDATASYLTAPPSTALWKPASPNTLRIVATPADLVSPSAKS